jgi:hypothetical protein
MELDSLLDEGAPPESTGFDPELVRGYPKANRRIQLAVRPYSIAIEGEMPPKGNEKAHTTFISPHGLEFQIPADYAHGTLLKIDVNIPDFWSRKQQFVDYSRIDSPQQFKILAKVVHIEEIGKRGRRKLVLAQTVNIDEVDEQVLKAFLQEGK